MRESKFAWFNPHSNDCGHPLLLVGDWSAAAVP
jgi:hypothetical protein